MKKMRLIAKAEGLVVVDPEALNKEEKYMNTKNSGDLISLDWRPSNRHEPFNLTPLGRIMWKDPGLDMPEAMQRKATELGPTIAREIFSSRAYREINGKLYRAEDNFTPGTGPDEYVTLQPETEVKIHGPGFIWTRKLPPRIKVHDWDNFLISLGLINEEGLFTEDILSVFAHVQASVFHKPEEEPEEFELDLDVEDSEEEGLEAIAETEKLGLEAKPSDRVFTVHKILELAAEWEKDRARLGFSGEWAAREFERNIQVGIVLGLFSFEEVKAAFDQLHHWQAQWFWKELGELREDTSYRKMGLTRDELEVVENETILEQIEKAELERLEQNPELYQVINVLRKVEAKARKNRKWLAEVVDVKIDDIDAKMTRAQAYKTWLRAQTRGWDYPKANRAFTYLNHILKCYPPFFKVTIQTSRGSVTFAPNYVKLKPELEEKKPFLSASHFKRTYQEWVGSKG